MLLKVVHLLPVAVLIERKCTCAAQAITASTCLINFITQINSALDGRIDKDERDGDQCWSKLIKPVRFSQVGSLYNSAPASISVFFRLVSVATGMEKA